VNLALWRDISIVWLSLFCFIGLLIPLAALYFGVRGVNRGLAKARVGLQMGQKYSRSLRAQSEVLSQKVSEPVIRTQKQAVSLGATLRSLWPQQR
jgi:hypothetical protein